MSEDRMDGRRNENVVSAEIIIPCQPQRLKSSVNERRFQSSI